MLTDDVALFDGILGVAFPILSQDPGVPTVLQNLAYQKKIDQSQFCFFLGDVSFSSYCTTSFSEVQTLSFYYLTLFQNAPGELTIGGYDTEKIDGDITWVDVIEPAYWVSIIGSFTMNSSILPLFLTCVSIVELLDHLVRRH